MLRDEKHLRAAQREAEDCHPVTVEPCPLTDLDPAQCGCSRHRRRGRRGQISPAALELAGFVVAAQPRGRRSRGFHRKKTRAMLREWAASS